MPTAPSTMRSILALDVGAKRVGVAVASAITRLPRPLATLERNEAFFSSLQQLLEAEAVDVLVVGLPRGLSGQHTAQTAATETFIGQLREHFSMPVHLQDEALTSRQAEAELQARGKPYKRGDIDALAATYILQDFLTGNRLEGEPKS
ncbi:MAG TPA: Holliday junction resolvase RuvX [Verrucomicrobiae bacterium]|jgi:putative Holliday junction resolvase|nr:Holliday junction resolvase RuvX [Verrucomicrobiae bacterium]